MREAVIISYGSRTLPGPLGLKSDIKTSIYFLPFPTFNFWAYFLQPIWAMVTRPVQGPSVRRYGGSQSAKGDKTLAFELFVELLVETARKRYGTQAGDAESTAGLFEEHLLPLARQLSSLEGNTNPQTPNSIS